MKYARYEFLLPLAYNNGAPIPSKRFGDTRRELLRRFGALTVDVVEVAGTWVYKGIEYNDRLLRFRVDVPQSRANRVFFSGYKSVLKRRFRQKDIWITVTEMDVL